MKAKILVIGSSNTDMIIKLPRIPAPGETLLGGEFFKIPGGKGANQAVAAARAGGEVVFVACVGNDVFGKEAIANYSKEGINVSHIKISNEKPSGIALINVADSGENSISVAPGANACLLPEDILKLESLIQSAHMILLQHEIPFETVQTVIEMAYKHGIRVILNPAPAMTVPSELLQKLFLLTPNEHEAALIAGNNNSQGNEPFQLAEKLYKCGCQQMIITLGAQGAYFSDGQTSKIIPGFNVKAVDTTAAGDTFNGYLAVAIARGDSIENAILRANKAASISVTRLGAQSSIPFAHEITL